MDGILPFYVDQAFVLEVGSLLDLEGHHISLPTIADGDITVQFGTATAMLNKHAASPGANEFRSDVLNGKIQLTFVAGDVVHRDVRIKFVDQTSPNEWLDTQRVYRLLYHTMKFDGNYIRYYRGDGTTVSAHRALSLAGGITTAGPIIDGAVP